MVTKEIVVHQGNGETGTPKPAVEKVPVRSAQGLVSIVIPCCGMLEYTKLCVPSVLKHSRMPFEIIFIDIGSLDGTAEYLAGLKTGLPVRVEIVRTATDLGIPDAIKEGLRLAIGDYLVLLNNDTVVTNGWLTQLTGLAKMSDTIGLVGPMSNYAAPPQLVDVVPYRSGLKKKPKSQGLSREEPLVDADEVNRFAGEFREKHRTDKNKGAWCEAERLGGFCLLVKREVLDKIGSKLDK